MAVNTRLVAAPADQVWNVLADGWLYPLFVVGASRMRQVDDHWPQPGARLHHSVGVWPALLDDTTSVLETEPGSMIRLRARGWPGGEAEVTIRLRPRGQDTEVSIAEDAVSGPGEAGAGPAAAPAHRLAQRRDAAPPVVPGRASGVAGHRAGMTRSSHDALVVGAGPNGLVAANLLADAGWSVLVLEAQATPGGAVRSDRDLHADFVTDTFSAFYPFAAVSPALRALGLEEHGLTWRHAPAVLGHPTLDGEWALQTRDREQTAAWMDQASPGDGDAWLDLCATWDQVGDHLVAGLLSPFPPVRAGLGLAARLPRAGGLDLVKLLLTPVSDLGRQHFGGRAPALLLAGNAGHSDMPLTSPGSGVFGLLMTMLGQTVGFPVPEGGASALSDGALVRRLEARGGEVRCGCEVTGVRVVDGRARGVTTADGEQIDCARAVLADVGERALRPARGAGAPARRHHLGHAPLPAGPRDGEGRLGVERPGAVGLAAGGRPRHLPRGGLRRADRQGDRPGGGPPDPGRPVPPGRPDDHHRPTRSPAGTESLWAYAHVPQPDPSVRDAGADEIRGVWDESDRERFGDRIQARIERLARASRPASWPTRPWSPRVEARDANLVGGAVNGGPPAAPGAGLRPVPRMSAPPETGVRGLFLASASAHPGGGVHGAPGSNAARAALLHARLGRLRRSGGS